MYMGSQVSENLLCATSDRVSHFPGSVSLFSGYINVCVIFRFPGSISAVISDRYGMLDVLWLVLNQW